MVAMRFTVSLVLLAALILAVPSATAGANGKELPGLEDPTAPDTTCATYHHQETTDGAVDVAFYISDPSTEEDVRFFLGLYLPNLLHESGDLEDHGQAHLLSIAASGCFEDLPPAGGL